MTMVQEKKNAVLVIINVSLFKLLDMYLITANVIGCLQCVISSLVFLFHSHFQFSVAQSVGLSEQEFKMETTGFSTLRFYVFTEFKARISVHDIVTNLNACDRWINDLLKKTIEDSNI